ncbi:MAG: hypothetical protein MJ093_00685 [Saccharofermentans sp.]|nr:hypothetical protein [Saccharofermentans sp.]
MAGNKYENNWCNFRGFSGITKGYTNLYACVAIGDDEYLTNDSSHFHTKMGYKALGTFSRCGKSSETSMIWCGLKRY